MQAGVIDSSRRFGVQRVVARWEFVLRVDREKGVPLFQQIARAVADEISRGRLRPGDRLPSTRTLARTLGVQRLTVVSAMDDLAAEGWIVTQLAWGPSSRRRCPTHAPRTFSPSGAAPFVPGRSRCSRMARPKQTYGRPARSKKKGRLTNSLPV